MKTTRQAIVAAALAAAFCMGTFGAVSAQSTDGAQAAVTVSPAAKRRCTPGYSPCIPNKAA